MKVELQRVRLAFPALFKAKAFPGAEVAYFSAVFPIVPDSANDKLLRAAISTVVKEALGEKAKATLEQLYKKGRVFYKDGPLEDKHGDPYMGFEGMNHAKSSNAQRVVCVNRDAQVVSESEGLFYPGCVVNATLDVWFHQAETGNRINGRLLGVQFVKDGEPFGGGVRITANSFKAIEEDEEEESLD